MKQISPWTRKNLHIQGFTDYSDTELNELKYGIRFAYLGCATVVAIGLALKSIPVLGIAMLIAFLAVVLPHHPFDYLYNAFVYRLLQKPKAPIRTSQGKFACGIATAWLAGVIILLHYSYPLAANLLGAVLLLQAFTVGTIDFCVPSRIFNALFRKK